MCLSSDDPRLLGELVPGKLIYMTLIKIATNKIYSTEWPGEEKFAWQMLSKN